MPLRDARSRQGISRRRWLAGVSSSALSAAGCVPVSTTQVNVEKVWGSRGNQRGQFLKPRAIAIDAEDRLYIVDMTARIQVFDRDGQFLRSWRTPAAANGKPCGLSIDRRGALLVADTHYYRVLAYQPSGLLIRERTVGGVCGSGPGEFQFVTDAVQDSAGNLYVAQYGEFDRIQKFDPDGNFLMRWGGQGSEPGQLLRPQALAIDRDDLLWVADACNHRIQVFDARQEPVRLLQVWGEQGTQPGQLRYPYGIIIEPAGDIVVCEFGNHRVQRLTADGKFLAALGGPGTGPGQFAQPWSAARDSQGALHVLDSYNHRVQRVRLG